ncbi:MAG: prepilin-type N-terminal cleavage/methylation domain-containing protein [Planctomycetota bacterium]
MPRHSQTTARQGFTLMELLAVMSIMAVLMGIGIGVFSKLNVSKYGAVGIVRNALRSARESAMGSGMPVTLVCDPQEKKMYDLSVAPFAHFQFEDFNDGSTGTMTTLGAFDIKAQLNGAMVAAGGRVSGGLFLNKKGAYASASLGANADYAFTNGLAADADVYAEELSNCSVIKRTKQFHIGITADGAAEAQVSLAEDVGPDAKPAGTLVAISAPGLLVAKRWHRIGFIYDRVSLTLHIDGVTVATKISKAGEPVVRDNSPLEMGNQKVTFRGRLDGVKLGAVAPGDGIPLPREVSFGFQNIKLAVHFLPDGRLDPNWHKSPIVIPLDFPENVKKTITVGVYGTAR